MKRRGFSLVEVQVTVVLLLFALVVLYQAVSYGLRAHRKGEAARQATAFAREILSRMSAELATAVALDVFQADPLHGIDKDFQSAVLWPDSYPPLTVAFTDAFYGRERPAITLGPGRTSVVDRAHNRLIFSRPGKVADANYSDRDYQQFVYVEYLVANGQATGGEGQNRLYRRVYQVADAPLTPPRGVVTSGTQRTVVQNFFLFDPSSPFGNPNTTLTSLTSQQRAEQQVVLELPKRDDQISFTVDHLPYVDPTGRPSPPAPAYDPSTFSISVTVSLQREGNAKFTATRTLSEQVRVKSGT